MNATDPSPDFFLSKIKRSFLILSASYLILNYIITGFSFLFKEPQRFGIIGNALSEIIYLLSFAYIFFTFISCFKHYRHRTLELVSLIVFSSALANCVLTTINWLFPIIPNNMFDVLSVVSVSAELLWIILVLILKSELNYPVKTIKKFALWQVVSIGIGIVIGLITILGEHFLYANLMYLAYAIPYIYVIVFALRINKQYDRYN